jgi:predicted phosphodiesterase
MKNNQYDGLLIIGDPHLSSRTPGFRKDNYQEAILNKMKWIFNYCKENKLLPLVLGDWFHYPRDNSNSLLVQLNDIIPDELIGIYGNHDCNENSLTDEDSLSVLLSSGMLNLLDKDNIWEGKVGGESIVILGAPWAQNLPEKYDKKNEDTLVFCIAHHDVKFKGYEEAGRFSAREIPGIDLLINGHIHRNLPDIIKGKTTWMNPGNISRIKRSDSTRERIPSVLRIDIKNKGWTKKTVVLPYEAFEDVFYEDIITEEIIGNESVFVQGLESLQALKTQGGAGLIFFLNKNLAQFDKKVSDIIMELAKEVCKDDEE